MHRRVLKRSFASGPAKPAAPAVKPAATPVAAPAKPAVPASPAQTPKAGLNAPGTADTKQGAGLGGLLIPLVAIGGAAGGYYAYQNGMVPADLFGLAPLLGLTGSEEEKKSQASATVKPFSAAPVTAPSSQPKPAAVATPVPAKAPEQPKKEAAPAPASAAATSSSAAAAKPPAPPAAPVEAKKPEAPKPAAAEDDRVELHKLLWAKQLAEKLVAAEKVDKAKAKTAPVSRAASPAPSATPKKAEAAAAAPAPVVAAPAPAAAAAPAPAAAPVQPPQAQPTPLTKAKEEVAQWKVEQLKNILSSATTTDAENVGREVDVLTVSELREKVLRLSADLAARSKYEALHLVELLKQADQQWESKFEAFAAAKHAEAEAFVKEQLQQAHKALSKEFEEASVEAKKRIEEEAQRVYSSLFKKEVSQALDAMGNESEQRIKKMERLREAVIGPTEALLASRLDYEDSARKAHRVNAAVLALTGALNEPRPATQEIAALKVAGEGDKVIGAALALLPPQVHGTKGVPTLSSLQLRFHHVLHAARVASLTPEGTGVIGQAVGTAAAKLVVPSSHALTSGGNAPSSSSSAASGTVVVSPSSAAAPVVKPSPSTSPATAAAMERSLTGMIAPFFSTAKDGVSSLYSKLVGSSPSPSGSASSSPIDAAPKELKETVAAVGEVVHKATGKVKEVAAVAKERTQEVRTFNETMEKADALVQKGDLDAAVKILEALEGSPAEVARDWVEQARLRIATDRAASVARSRAIVLTASMY